MKTFCLSCLSDSFSRWLDRCWNAHGRKHDQALFGIVQGGLEPKLRDICLEELVKRDLPGLVEKFCVIFY